MGFNCLWAGVLFGDELDGGCRGGEEGELVPQGDLVQLRPSFEYDCVIHLIDHCSFFFPYRIANPFPELSKNDYLSE